MLSSLSHLSQFLIIVLAITITLLCYFILYKQVYLFPYIPIVIINTRESFKQYLIYLCSYLIVFFPQLFKFFVHFLTLPCLKFVFLCVSLLYSDTLSTLQSLSLFY